MSLGVARGLVAGAGYQLELEGKPSSCADVAMKGILRSGVWELWPLWGQEWRWTGGWCEAGEVGTERGKVKAFWAPLCLSAIMLGHMILFHHPPIFQIPGRSSYWTPLAQNHREKGILGNIVPASNGSSSALLAIDDPTPNLQFMRSHFLFQEFLGLLQDI